VLALAEDSLNDIERFILVGPDAIASIIDITIGLFILYTIIGSAAFLLLAPTACQLILSPFCGFRWLIISSLGRAFTLGF
jgi:hypothetical protein